MREEKFVTPVSESAGSWTKVNGSWPETADKTYADYGKATKLGIVNKYKKATIVVNKKVENTSDNTAHGDTSVDGAVYRMYTDAACTNPVTTVYDANGNAKAASDYTIKNGTLETDYIRTKDTVYIKEIKAPEGFFLDPTVHQIKVDGSQFDVEYKAKAVIEDSYESEKKGFFEVYKMSSDGSTGPADFEEGAEFQIYLRSNGSYDKCKDDEHSTLTIDKKGSAKTASALAMVRTCFIRQRQVQRTLKRLMTKSLKLVRTSQVRDLITKHIHISITTNHLRHT